ncbi:MAG: hypothetical protein KF685_02565 [Acidobacteria bacterium]|nr:hypothetical protein [Acidobacteriota bacterium]
MSVSLSYLRPFYFFGVTFLLFVLLNVSGSTGYAQSVKPELGIGHQVRSDEMEPDDLPRGKPVDELPSLPVSDDPDEPFICVPTYYGFDLRRGIVSAEDKPLIPAKIKDLAPISIVTSEQKRSVFETTEPTSMSARFGRGFSLSKKQIIEGFSFDDTMPLRPQYGGNFADNDDEDDDGDETSMPSEKFHWRPAIRQSLMFLSVQHGYALIFQEKTRRALKGPFFSDYWRSIKGTSGWDDGNRFFTNYIAHPMQGGLTGFIYVQNHDRSRKQMFAESRQYWRDRAKAFVWSAAWSTQFELGPISQSSIGNVGMYGRMGYVDLVITPTVGTAWLISEEAIDRYIIRHVETKSFLMKVTMRMLLNPMRTMANLLRFREPWYRDRPFGH